MPIRSPAKQFIASLLLFAACTFGRSASALTWSAETVDDPAANVGDFSDIALDASGRPHIAYRDATSFDLKFATKTASGSWKIEVIDSAGQAGFGLALALDSGGSAHVTYFRAPDATSNGSLLYAKRRCSSILPTLCTWSRETVAPGVQSRTLANNTSIAIDSAQNPHVSYFDNVSGQLKWAKRTPENGWASANVTPAPASGISAVDIDAFDFPQVTFSDTASGVVRHARIVCVFILCGWSFESVDAGSLGAMKLSASDVPNLVYVQNGSVFFALRSCAASGTGTCAWTREFVGATGSPRRPDVALDSGGGPHLTFLRERGFGIADLIYARRTGPIWGLELADLDARSIGQSSIALDASNLPQLSFQSTTTQALRTTRGRPRSILPPIFTGPLELAPR